MTENTHKGEGGGITDPAYPARFMHAMEGWLAQETPKTYTVYACPECGNGPFRDSTYVCLHYADGDCEAVPPGVVLYTPALVGQRPTRTVAPQPLEVVPLPKADQ